MRLVQIVPDAENLSVLEWGCGAGRVTQFLDGLFKSVVAVDISKGIVERAKALGLEHTEYHVIKGNILPLPDHSIDLVYSYVTWMHLPTKNDLVVILAECKRVLVPGGRVVFQLPLYEKGSDRPATSPGGIACWTAAELQTVLESQGWETVNLRVNDGAFGGTTWGSEHFNYHEIRSPQVAVAG